MKGKILIPSNSPAAVPSNPLTISAIRKMGCLKTSNPFRLIGYVLILCVARLFLVGCASGSGWTAAEREIIGNPIPGTTVAPAASAPATGTNPGTFFPAILRVLTVDNPADSAILRTPCTDLTPEMLSSPEYARLAELMVATVTDPSEDGVGIAGPQVGISRRIVAVQRFDKPGEPFEVYPNIRIVATRGDLCPGPEGCLSVPGRRGTVLRSRDIDIRYTLVPATAANGAPAAGTPSASTSPASTSPAGTSSAGSSQAGTPLALRDTVERIQSFTAVIFQHECDHLDGILYIDKLEPAF